MKYLWCEELESEVPDPPHITVHEDDTPQPTGLLDEHGNELYRVPERIQMGFRAK